MGSLMILLVAACVHSAHPLAAAREVALMGGLVVLALALSGPLANAAVRDRMLDVLAVGSAVYGAVWITTFLLAGVVALPFAPWELLLGFDNPRFLNHAQSVALPLAGVVLLRETSPSWLRRTAAFALFSGGAILAFYLARASILALLVGAVAALLAVGRPGHRYIALMVFWLAGGALAVGVAWMTRYRFLVETMTDSVLSGHYRGYLSERAFDFFLASPWVGVGPMHFAQSLNPIAAHPHNMYLQTLAECGLPATLVLLWFALRGLRMAARAVWAMRPAQPVLAAALTASLVAMLVDGAFSGNFVMPLSQMWCAMLMGLLIAQHQATTVESSNGEARISGAAPQTRYAVVVVWRWAVAASLLLAAAFAISEVLDPVGPHIHTGEPKKIPVSGEIFNPRFWSHGWF